MKILQAQSSLRSLLSYMEVGGMGTHHCLAFLEEARRRNWTPPAAGYVPAPVRIQTARSDPSKPQPKPKPKRVRAGSESEGEESGEDSGDEKDGDKGKNLLHKFFEDGDGL